MSGGHSRWPPSARTAADVYDVAMGRELARREEYAGRDLDAAKREAMPHAAGALREHEARVAAARRELEP